MTQWTPACAADDIETEDMIRFDHEGRRFLIYRGPDGAFYCTDGICTHEHIGLEDGLVDGFEIECPKHAAAFDYRTGEALRAPACVDLRTYPTRVEDGRVWIEL